MSEKGTQDDEFKAEDCEEMEKISLKALAKCIRDSAKQVHPWSLSELVIGLKYMFAHHKKLRDSELEKIGIKQDKERHTMAIPDSLKSQEVSDRHTLADLLYWAVYAEAPYKKNKELCAKFTSLAEDDFIHYVAKGTPLRPAFFIAKDHKHKQIVFAIRGTKGMADALTDVSNIPSEFLGGTAHKGMVDAAQCLFKSHRKTLLQALATHPGYGLTVVGHSLGAGTAALLTHLLCLDSEFDPASVRAFAFATPACVSASLTGHENITSIVMGYDIVARASVLSIQRLQDELAEIDWKTAALEDVQRTKLAQGFLKMRGKINKSKRTDRARRALKKAKESKVAQKVKMNASKVSKSASSLFAKLKGNKAAPDTEQQEEPLQDMFVPGRICHIVYDAASSSGFLILRVDDPLVLARIELSKRMVSDHLMATYSHALHALVGA